jgi:hypothetical protein
MIVTEVLRYSIPRNAFMANEFGFIDVLRSGMLAPHKPLIDSDRVEVWRGAELPPRGSNAMDKGYLAFYRKGIVFLPLVSYTPQELALLPAQIAAGLAIGTATKMLPLPHDLSGQAGSKVAEKLDEWVSAKTARGHMMKSFTDKHCFAFGYCDVVEASVRQVDSGFGVGDYVVITLERHDGSRESYTFKDYAVGMMGSITRRLFDRDQAKDTRERFWAIPSYLFVGRVVQEIDDYVITCKRGNIDLHRVVEPVVGRLQAQFGEQWTEYARDFMEEINELVDHEVFNVKGFTLAQVYQCVLASMEPVLQSYREVPRMRYEIEIIEARARGENDAWRPTWRPPDY